MGLTKRNTGGGCSVVHLLTMLNQNTDKARDVEILSSISTPTRYSDVSIVGNGFTNTVYLCLKKSVFNGVLGNILNICSTNSYIIPSIPTYLTPTGTVEFMGEEYYYYNCIFFNLSGNTSYINGVRITYIN